jgi:alkylation response protein AidB-like acyl-CoA dehydrogenase
VDTRLSPEQITLRDSAASLVENLGPKSVQQLVDPERISKLQAAVAGTGWHELRAPTDGWAPLASTVEVAIVAEELALGVADVAFVGPTLAAELRRLAQAPAAASSETVAFAADLSTIACVTTGTAPPDAVAVDADGSKAVLLCVSVPGGYRLVGTRLAKETHFGVDLTRTTAPLLMEDPLNSVPNQRRIVTEEDLARWRAFGLSLTCADLIGAMRGAIRLACDYARSRRQYGVTIGSFQAIQHLLADAFVSMEGSRSVALHAAWAADALPADEALAAAAVAKAYCARSARTACEIAIQVHGGIGNTWDCLAHVYLRRALHSSDLLGGVGPSLALVREHHGMGAQRGLR